MCVDEQVLGNGLQIAGGCLDRLAISVYTYVYLHKEGKFRKNNFCNIKSPTRKNLDLYL